MSSEPEYFYTVELPEKFGRILEKLALDTGGIYTPEEMAERLLCDALEREDREGRKRRLQGDTAGRAERSRNNGPDEDLPI